MNIRKCDNEITLFEITTFSLSINKTIKIATYKRKKILCDKTIINVKCEFH